MQYSTVVCWMMVEAKAKPSADGADWYRQTICRRPVPVRAMMVESVKPAFTSVASRVTWSRFSLFRDPSIIVANQFENTFLRKKVCTNIEPEMYSQCHTR